MIFSSSYDLLDKVYYKKLPGVITDIQFSLDDESGYVVESYGVSFDNNTYQMYIDPSELTFQPPIPVSMS